MSIKLDKIWGKFMKNFGQIYQNFWANLYKNITLSNSYGKIFSI
jgi:hypothetical protein